MSRFRVTDGYTSQKGFAHLPKIGDSVPGEFQPRGSLDSGSISSRFSGVSSQRAARLEEGDLITGTIDITHERAYMLPPIRDEDRAEEKKALEEYIISLKIIPPNCQDSWTLDHPSNTTWLSLPFHRHHDTYATVLIAPSVEDSMKISHKIWLDNWRRGRIIDAGGPDPGRNDEIDWSEGTNGEYELVILRPDHFLIDNAAVLIKHPSTQNLTCFYNSKYKDGHLCEGSPTGLPLQSFHSRGRINRVTPLNPMLVNYAAILRLRRLIRQDPFWGATLSETTITVLRDAMKLHRAVIWTPDGSRDTQFKIKDLSSQPPVFRDLRGWPDYPRATPEPNPGIDTGVPTTALDRAFALLEEGIFEGFGDPPELGDGDHSHHCLDLLSDLGAMDPQEKMERFLAAF